MNVDAVMRAYAEHKAAAAVCESLLKGMAQASFVATGAAGSWKPYGVGRLDVSVNHDGVQITDHDLFIKWVAARFPMEVVTVPQVRNQEWQKHLLATLDPIDPEEVKAGEGTPCMAGDGEIVPGVVWYRGGGYRTASITVDPGLKRQAAAAARAAYAPADAAEDDAKPATS